MTPGEQELRVQSRCDAWTVRQVLGHLVMPLSGSTGGFLAQVVRARGSLERASEALALALAGRPVALADLHGPGVPLLHERLRGGR